MMTRRDQIINNEVMAADFSAEPISDVFADEIAKALLNNTSVQQLSFSGTNLKEKGFENIVDALIARKQKIPKHEYKPIILNIDNTYLTASSKDAITKLIANQIVKTLLMYSVDGINDKTQVGIDLTSFAKGNGVNISYDHPRKRAAIGFFDKSKDEQKDPTINNLGKNEQETKEQPSIPQTNSKKF